MVGAGVVGINILGAAAGDLVPVGAFVLATVIFGFVEGLGVGAPSQHWIVTGPKWSQKVGSEI